MDEESQRMKIAKFPECLIYALNPVEELFVFSRAFSADADTEFIGYGADDVNSIGMYVMSLSTTVIKVK